MHQLATLSDLHDQDHSLAVYCVACDRWADVDLNAMVLSGNGSRVIATTRFTCRTCGADAEKQVRPPVPEVGHAVAYVAFPVASNDP